MTHGWRGVLDAGLERVIANQDRQRAVCAEIDRQNLARVWILAGVVVFFMLFFLWREWSYLGMSGEELGALFRVDHIDPALFQWVVGYRFATLAAVLLIVPLAWRWRQDDEKRGHAIAAFIGVVGGLLIATATLNLAFRDAFDLFYLQVFIFSAMFFVRPRLALVFFSGAFIVYALGASWVMPESTGTRMDALFTNVGIMTGLAMIIAVQNYRIKFRELDALETTRQDNAALQQANRVITLSSETDSLTGVFNRRALDRDMEQLQRKRLPYVLAMLDLDHFKPFNDHYGHQAGDRALQAVAGCLERGLKRRTDRVYRYGGEEFVVLLRDTDIAGGRVAMKALRRQVEALAIAHAYRDDAASVVTVSIGLAESAGKPAADVLEQADKCLYESKAAGRNQVMPAAVA